MDVFSPGLNFDSIAGLKFRPTTLQHCNLILSLFCLVKFPRQVEIFISVSAHRDKISSLG